MIATIEIKDLTAQAIIGVYEHEKNQKQTLVFNIKLQVDIAKAANSDDLADALDYHAVSLGVLSLAETSRCELLEVLATEICHWIMQTHDPIGLELSVSKPGAVAQADSVSLTLVYP